MSEPHICSFGRSSSVLLSGLNAMGMYTEHVVVTVYVMFPVTLPEQARTHTKLTTTCNSERMLNPTMAYIALLNVSAAAMVNIPCEEVSSTACDMD